MNFYVVPDKIGRVIVPRQGDIINPVPFAGFSITQADMVLPGTKSASTFDLTSETVVPGSRILAIAEQSIGMILNQDCDITGQPGKERPILVSRVSPCRIKLKKFDIANTKKLVSDIHNLSNPGRYPNLFYLPEYTGPGFTMERSVADLLEVFSFPSVDLGALASLIQLRLSDTARQSLQERLAYCFGRFGAPDDLLFNESEWQFHCEEQERKRP